MDILTQLPQSSLHVLDAAIKATVILLAASLAVAALRRSSAATRHLVWTSALLAALALPLLASTLPRWEAPVVTLPHASTPPDRPAATQAYPASSRVERGAGGASAPRTVAPSPGAPSALASVSWTTVAAIVWIAGTVLILGRLLLGVVLVQLMSRRSSAVCDAPWLPLAHDLAADLGVARVTFRRGRRGTMPMAWGVFRPAVLMPEDADAWPEERLRIVLLHELAHVKRADCLTHMLAQAACALYWMNPLTWLAARGARTERERACDDLVLAHGTPGADYADQLLEIARTLDHGRPAPAIAGASLAMAYRSQLEGRLMSILDPSVRRSGTSRLRAVALTTLGLAFAASLATIQTWAFEDAAMLPKTARPAVPAPKADHSAGASAQSAAGEQDPRVVRRAVQEAVESATRNVEGGLIPGIAAGVVGGIVEGVAAGIGEGVQQAAKKPGTRSEPDPKLVAALMEALKDSDREVREAAMHALVRMRAPGMVDPLMAALKDASPDIREQAAFGLGQLRDKRAVAPLTAALQDEDADVREGAAFALGQLRDPSAVPGLTTALRDENASVREQAAFALGQLRARDAVEPLIAALKDENRSVREQAAFALGQIGDARAADALIALLKDPDAQVRQQAAFALSQIR